MRLVLVLDDNAVDAMQVERALAKSRPRARVITKMSAKAALRLLEEGSVFPDLLFVDVQLDPAEGIDGFQFVALARQYAHAPIVLMSGAVDDKMRRIATGMGAVPLISKPARKDGWLQKIGVACAFYWDVTEPPLGASAVRDTELPVMSSRTSVPITEPPPTPDASDFIDVDWDPDSE